MEIKLSTSARVILLNQYLILEALYPEQAEEFKHKREIVTNGYELHYDTLNPLINENKISIEACREVMDILDMHRALYRSYDKLDDKSGIDEYDIRFNGFDGNDSNGYLSYARFLILTEKRWPEILEHNNNASDLNSHSDNLHVYQRMLVAWEKCEKNFTLDKSQIQEIVRVRTHPDHRK